VRILSFLLLLPTAVIVAAPVHSQPVPARAAVVFSPGNTASISSAATPLVVPPTKRASPIKRGMIVGAITGAVIGIGAMQTAGVGCDTSLIIGPDGKGRPTKCSTLGTRVALLSWGAGVGVVVGGATGGVIGGVVRLVRGSERNSEHEPHR
jgi:hypothetical protein